MKSSRLAVLIALSVGCLMVPFFATAGSIWSVPAREGKNYQITSAMQTGRAYGQKLMNDALMELIQNGKVEPMEAYLKCPDKESFMATLKRNNCTWDPRGEERPMPL